MRRALLPAVLLLAGCAMPGGSSSSGPRYRGEPLAHWMEEIRDLDPARKEQAAKALQYFGAASSPAVPDLLEATRHETCRTEVSRTLEAIGPSCLPAVIAAMGSPDARVRNGASLVLTEFVERGARGPEILAALDRALGDRDGAALHATYAVAELGPDGAPFVPKLEALAAGDEKLRVTEAARSALKRIRPEK